MRRIKSDGRRCEMQFTTTTAFPNALRRALVSDVPTFAPEKVIIRSNTSSQTDEYIAHRIGLIPFMGKDTSQTVRLNVTGRTATTNDFVGDAFRAISDTPIIRLVENQTIDLDVHFSKGTASTHAKYAHIGPVSFKCDENGKTELSFTMLTDDCPLDYTLSALKTLLKRIDDATYEVETQYDDSRKIV